MSVTSSLKGEACIRTLPQFCISLQACSFGLIVRYISAYTRSRPVLPGEKRSHRDIACPHQVSMQRIGATRPQAVGAVLMLTDEQQSFSRTVLLICIAAVGATLAGVVRIHLDR